jgi:hypothetical protein
MKLIKIIFIFLSILIFSNPIKTEELSFTDKLNLIDNKKIEILADKIQLIADNNYCTEYPSLYEHICEEIKSKSVPSIEQAHNYQIEIFADLLDYEFKNRTGCRIMWEYDLPESEKEKYCNKKSIYDLGKYKNVAIINNDNLLEDMFGYNYKSVNKLKQSLEFVQTNIIKKLKKLKSREKIIRSMAYFEVLISEIIKIPSYEVNSLNELLHARDIFRNVLNIPLNASADHAAYRFFWGYGKDISCSDIDKYVACNIQAAQQKDYSLKKFQFYMNLKTDFNLMDEYISQLQERDQSKIKKETSELAKDLIEIKDNLNSNVQKNLAQVSNNLESITKESKKVFLAFDHWGDLGPTIDLGNGRGLNLITGEVGRYRKLGN